MGDTGPPSPKAIKIEEPGILRIDFERGYQSMSLTFEENKETTLPRLP
jgi:hypothetical protein